MGRLDKRTARDEDDRSARQTAEQRRVSREQQLREAQAAAARTAAQETLVNEVYELVNEFLELMEGLDYPGLQTITLPMTRWWWPFPRPTRKAAWTVFSHDGEKRVIEYPGYINEAHEAKYTWYERVYLLAEEETLVYQLRPGFGSGYNQEKEAFREWDGEHAQAVKAQLKGLTAQYSR